MALPFYVMVDFDGVLQDPSTDPFIPMRDAKNLAHLVEASAAVRFVVTSTHREGKTLAHLQSWFPESLRPLVVGMTPVLAEGRAHGGRQREIETWLSTRPHAGWLALDAEVHLYDPECLQLVHVFAFMGFDVELAKVVADEIRATLLADTKPK